MTEKEMKKLSRAELLELLLLQTKETERMRKRLDRAEAELAERQLKFQQVGSLAQAVMEVNGVMEAAQAAAEQYLENIARMEEEARQRCEKMIADAQQEAEQIRGSVPQPVPEEHYPMEDQPLEDHLVENSLLQEIYDLLEK